MCVVRGVCGRHPCDPIGQPPTDSRDWTRLRAIHGVRDSTLHMYRLID
jgi:hypothetical protein